MTCQTPPKCSGGNPTPLTRKGVLILLVSVSRMWTFSCWCSRMKRRKICRRAGSEMLRRKRSRYAVVVMTSSTVTCGQTTEQREHGEHPSGIQLLPPPWPCKGKKTPAPRTPSEEALNPNNFHPSSGHFCPLTQPGGSRGIKKQFRDSAPLLVCHQKGEKR